MLCIAECGSVRLQFNAPGKELLQRCTIVIPRNLRRAIPLLLEQGLLAALEMTLAYSFRKSITVQPQVLTMAEQIAQRRQDLDLKGTKPLYMAASLGEIRAFGQRFSAN